MAGVTATPGSCLIKKVKQSSQVKGEYDLKESVLHRTRSSVLNMQSDMRKIKSGRAFFYDELCAQSV